MKQSKLLFLLIAALAFDSCRPTAQQTVADAEQPTDSTEAVTSAHPAPRQPQWRDYRHRRD